MVSKINRRGAGSGRPRWSTGRDLVRAFQARTELQPDKVLILNSVWDKEMGHLSKYWRLLGLRRGVLYVKPCSSAAAQELHLRGPEIIRRLNKYFSRPWIKAVKIAAR